MKFFGLGVSIFMSLFLERSALAALGGADKLNDTCNTVVNHYIAKKNISPGIELSLFDLCIDHNGIVPLPVLEQLERLGAAMKKKGYDPNKELARLRKADPNVAVQELKKWGLKSEEAKLLLKFDGNGSGGQPQQQTVELKGTKRVN